MQSSGLLFRKGHSYIEGQFTKEKIKMANKHTEKSLGIQNLKLKAIMRFVSSLLNEQRLKIQCI